MKRIFCAALLCLLPGLVAADQISVRSFEVILSHDSPAVELVGDLKFRGGIDMRSGAEGFGGFSGLDISPDGRRLIAVSDQGMWFTADLTYDRTGALNGLSNTALFPIRGLDGKPLKGRKSTDSESIARLTDGSLVVGFEQSHRLRRFPFPGEPAQRIRAPLVLGTSPPNGGAEAITRLWGNQLLILSERLEAREGIAAGWIGAGKEWRAVGFRKSGIFRPVGADTRDDGMVFLLERRFSTLGGLGTRISVVPGSEIAPGAIFKTRELAELSPPLVSDNFEGIAVRRTGGGETLIYIISDDNFHDLQRNLLLMFSLAE